MQSREREVLQLLRDYRTFHTPYGSSDGTINLESMGQHGPAGYIESGAEFKEHRHRLAESYELLEVALTLLKGEDYDQWLVLKRPYLGDPADPSIIDDLRRKAKKGGDRAEDIQGVLDLHDRAVERLAELLAGEDLYVVYPGRMRSQEAEQVDRRLKELRETYLRLRSENVKKTKAVKEAARICGYSESRVWDVVAECAS